MKSPRQGAKTVSFLPVYEKGILCAGRTTTLVWGEDAMKLLELYGDKIVGAIRGLDRVRFRGTLRWLSDDRGIGALMSSMGVLLKDFGRWVQSTTQVLRESCEQRARELGIDMIYLPTSSINKEELARQIAAERGIRDGSICMFRVVESCYAPTVEGDRATKRLVLRMRPRKCTWVYHYWDDPLLGFGHVRFQTWLPMTATICINGRHWLDKQMNARHMAYVKDGNCFPWIEDPQAAQALLDEQLKTNWPGLLNALLRETCPVAETLYDPIKLHYYWSADETEWATDVMFGSMDALEALYPTFLHYALYVSDSPSVMRYFGRRTLTAAGKIRGGVRAEIISDTRRRYEGIRLKHWINQNSLKLYNKSGSVLRVETTINNTRDFKVFRSPDDDESRSPSWQKLRKGVSDLHRRCEVSDQSNTRYLDAISAAHVEQTLHELAADACNPKTREGCRYRALNPWRNDDFKLLTFLAKGELALNGFRNKDLRRWLHPQSNAKNHDQQKKLSALATRRIRLLRAHGLIRKLPKVNRYVLSNKGQHFVTALLTASSLEAKALMEMAA
jgi:hypothetical protein